MNTGAGPSLKYILSIDEELSAACLLWLTAKNDLGVRHREAWRRTGRGEVGRYDQVNVMIAK